MWWKKNISDRVIIGCTPGYICLSWVQLKNSSATLMSYKKMECNSGELYKGVIFNPTKIHRFINKFLTQYRLSHAFVSMWIIGPTIVEKIVNTVTAHPTAHDLGINTQTHYGDWHYLYPLDNNHLSFYMTCIPKTLLLQYQLLAMACDINLTTITPYSHVLLHIYHYIQGCAFRQSTFMDDMGKVENNVAQLFTPEIIWRIMRIHPAVTINIADEYFCLLGIAGLYIMEKFDEKN